jgi:peptidoglycan/xylan/chitin deacetylase (PgdA/CDA1 family)
VRRTLCSMSLFAALCFTGAARAEGVALTFDDLPTMALTGDPTYAETTTTRLLAGLRRHHIPAIGFAIGERMVGDGGAAHGALVKSWLIAGMQIGNHTYAHVSLNKTPVADYIAGVSRTDQILRPTAAAQGRSLRWFRHPFLETGLTLETRRTFEAWLTAHGYRVAPVTMENSDHVFALPYDDALQRHDAAEAARIKKAYLDYTDAMVAWYRSAAFGLLGRRPDFVFLLHATRLNADSLDDLSSILRRHGLHTVSLDRAMRDPAYRIADAYAGPDGDEWLSRWSRTLKKQLPWESFREPPADIVAASDRLDSEP